MSTLDPREGAPASQPGRARRTWSSFPEAWAQVLETGPRGTPRLVELRGMEVSRWRWVSGSGESAMYELEDAP